MAIIKRIMCLYVVNVDDENVTKMLLLRVSNNFFFTKVLTCNYFYFELDINKFDGVFLKMGIILKKFRIFFLSRITRVFWRFSSKIVKEKKIIKI